MQKIESFATQAFAFVEPYAVNYGPQVGTMVTVAIVVYAVWGKTVLFVVVTVGSLIFFRYRDKITWLVNSDSFVSRLGRSIVVPFACASMGPLGIVALGVVNVSTAAVSEWGQYRHRCALEANVSRLEALNKEYKGIIEGFRALSDKFREQMVPVFAEIDRETPLDPNATLAAVMGHFQRRVEIVVNCAKDPSIAKVVSVHAKVQTVVANLERDVTAWETRLQQYQQQVVAANASLQRTAAFEQEISQLLQQLRGIVERSQEERSRALRSVDAGSTADR